VNMETGAGINYSTDMADYLHPNQTGYNKMAVKWFETLDNLNSPPVISSIPEQFTLQGTDFTGLSLDNFVSDNEDNDNQIVWTFDLGPNSKFLASIDGNRVLKVLINDNEWYGSDTLVIKAKDSGNGSFRKTDSLAVIFTVIKGNEPPVITSLPKTIINEDEIYTYILEAEDPDLDILTYSALQKPDWLTFSTSTRALTGRPSNDDIGTFNITLRVSDGDEFVDQNFELEVNNINDIPVIISTPVITIKTGESYFYEFMALDIDTSDHLTYSFISKPSWLNFTNGGNTATLSGIPTSSDLGANGVILKVSDGFADILQGFTISVSGQTALDPNTPQYIAFIYPNPTRGIVYIELEQLSDISMNIYDISGKLQIKFESVRTEQFKMDLSGLSNGFYIYKAIINHQPLEGKILKIQ
ncbi:MAG: T9SS C-terminal target domain-containing protein, partial [Alphaproteobacteria bacterium]